MSTINALKKEVGLLHKALTTSVEVPEWKKRSDEIIEILKKQEEYKKYLEANFSPEEQRRIYDDAVEECLAEVFKFNGKSKVLFPGNGWYFVDSNGEKQP